jgi:3-phenylpropionate/trans-cinnamate dioxygenase ferredoxin subunit
MKDLDPLYNWTILPDAEKNTILALENQQLVRIELEEKKICVTKLGNQFFGINDRCPHAGTPLSLSERCNKRGTVVCPTHHYKFNIKNGRSEDGNQYKISNYIFEQREEELFIGIRK